MIEKKLTMMIVIQEMRSPPISAVVKGNQEKG
jgi:hypothetical protein